VFQVKSLSCFRQKADRRISGKYRLLSFWHKSFLCVSGKKLIGFQEKSLGTSYRVSGKCWLRFWPKLFVFQVKSFSRFRQKTDRDSGKKLVVFQVSVDSASNQNWSGFR
jgi:hypothetical protein